MVVCSALVGLKYRTILYGTPESPEMILSKIHEFMQTSHPITSLDADAYATEMLSPDSVLPNVKDFSRAQLTGVVNLAENCVDADLKHNAPSVVKVLQWHRFECGISPDLPKDFFSNTPWFHPSGSSYVTLALKSGRSQFTDAQWLTSHKQFMHVSELSLLKLNGTSISPEESILAQLSLSELRGLSTRESFLIGKQFVSIRSTQLAKQDTSRNYLIYDIEEWMRFIDKTSFDVVKLDHQNCLLVTGDACWQPRYSFIRRIELLTYSLGGAGLAILLVVILSALSRRIISWSKVNRDREHMLQTLAHEIRTPVANLRLITETFRSGFDELSISAQKSFLELCNEVQRLDNLAQSSANFLQASNADGMTISKKVFLLKDYLEGLLEGFGEIKNEIEITNHAPKTKLHTDPFWLSVCIKNLLDNAAKHGQPPIRVLVTAQRRHVTISIQNEGLLNEDRLKVITKPFIKQNTSPGLGLGLSITKKSIETLNGRLKVTSNPPTFSLILGIAP